MGYSFIFKQGVGWMSQAFRSGKGSPFNPPGGHTGEDWAVAPGTPVYSPCDGYIRNSGWLSDNYLANDWWLTAMGGDTLVIDAVDANGRTETMPTFIIAHLQDSTAPVGTRVKKGQLIGLSGNSGTATTGPHAHIEVLPPNWDWNNGVYGRVNPRDYFTEYPSGSIAPQGTTTTKETTLSAAEVKQIKDHINAVLIGGYEWKGKLHPGIGMVVEENQRRIGTVPAKVAVALQGQIAGLSNALAQLAKTPGAAVDLEAVTEAAKVGAAEALDDLTATVTIQQTAEATK